MNRSVLASFILAVSVGTDAPAAPLVYQLPPETAEFRPGPGVETVTAMCGACHSADYVSTQPPNKGKAFWEAEVQKMIKVFKAPIEPRDAAEIVTYLAATY